MMTRTKSTPILWRFLNFNFHVGAKADPLVGVPLYLVPRKFFFAKHLVTYPPLSHLLEVRGLQGERAAVILTLTEFSAGRTLRKLISV